MEPKEVKPATIAENLIPAGKTSQHWFGYKTNVVAAGRYLSWRVLPGSKGEKPAPKGGNPKPPKNMPPILLWSARPWW